MKRILLLSLLIVASLLANLRSTPAPEVELVPAQHEVSTLTWSEAFALDYPGLSAYTWQYVLWGYSGN